MPPFHLAFRIDEIESTRRFFRDTLGCRQGREAANWIDFDFFGHQISAHLGPRPATVLTTLVAGGEVPLSHFGVVLDWPAWVELRDRIAEVGIGFVVAPHIRFVGQPGEQGTFFVADPSANVLEFKAYRHPQAMFDGATGATR